MAGVAQQSPNFSDNALQCGGVPATPTQSGASLASSTAACSVSNRPFMPTSDAGGVMTAVSANGPAPFGQIVVAGEERSALAIAAQRFGGEKTGAANGRHAATAPPVLRGPKALGAVLDHRNPCRRRPISLMPLVIRHLAEKTDRQDGPGPRRQGRLTLSISRLYVSGSMSTNTGLAPTRIDLRRADPGERHGDDLVTRPDARPRARRSPGCPSRWRP